MNTSYGDNHCRSRPCGLYVEEVVVLPQSLNNERLGNLALRLRSVILLLSAFHGVETLYIAHRIDVLDCVAKHIFDNLRV